MIDACEQSFFANPGHPGSPEINDPFQAPADRGEGPAELRARRRRALGYRRAAGYKGQTGPRSAANDARPSIASPVSSCPSEWRRIRRRRNWVGAGSCDSEEIDAHIDELLRRFVCRTATFMLRGVRNQQL